MTVIVKIYDAPREDGKPAGRSILAEVFVVSVCMNDGNTKGVANVLYSTEGATENADIEFTGHLEVFTKSLNLIGRFDVAGTKDRRVQDEAEENALRREQMDNAAYAARRLAVSADAQGLSAEGVLHIQEGLDNPQDVADAARNSEMAEGHDDLDTGESDWQGVGDTVYTDVYLKVG